MTVRLEALGDDGHWHEIPGITSVEFHDTEPQEQPEAKPTPLQTALTISRAVQTCHGCPSQWDAWTRDGQYLYLRYRWGSGTVDTEDGTEVASFTTGDPMGGVIDLAEFAARAGLVVAEDADIR